MKKNTIKLGKVALQGTKRATKASKAITLPAGKGGHHVTVVDANADTVADSLGLTADRRKELDKDIIADLNRLSSGERLNQAQAIAIACSNCDTDNEVAYATYIVTGAWVSHDLQNAIDLLNGQDGIKTLQTPDASTEGEAADADDNSEEGDDAGFAQFLAAMMGGEGMPAGNDEDADDATI